MSKQLLQTVKDERERLPRLIRIWVDGGFSGVDFLKTVIDFFGLILEVVLRTQGRRDLCCCPGGGSWSEAIGGYIGVVVSISTMSACPSRPKRSSTSPCRGSCYGAWHDAFDTPLRIFKYPLTNAVKYANASEIQVELVYEATQCSLHIKDDGKGFGVGSLPTLGGFGLLDMSERAERMGAQLTIQSQPGRGTEIVVIINQS